MVTLNEQMVPFYICCLVSNVKHFLSICLNVRQLCQYYNALRHQRKPASLDAWKLALSIPPRHIFKQIHL